MNSQPASINPNGQQEVFDVILSKEKTPIAYELKHRELVESGMTPEEADTFIQTTPIQLELIYSYGLGLWAIESEPLESISPFCPYSGTEIENPENE